MKKSTQVILFVLSLAFIVGSCSKENTSSKDDDIYKTSAMEDVDMMFKGDFEGFEKVITKPLVKIDDCKYIVEGTIEFHKGDQIIAVVDFGEGECDDIATKTFDGVSTEFSMKKVGDKKKFYKVIAEPIVKIEDCDYIVSGVVEFYSINNDTWLATIDFGDGECDEWATKTWDGGSKVFSMKK